MFKKTIESLTTTAKIANQVVKNRAFVETLVPKNRNHIVGSIIRCTCTDEEKARADFHGNAENEIDRVCPQGLAKGEFVEGWNSRIDNGASWQAQLMGSAAGTPANYVALAAAAITITHTDTYIGGTSSVNEITANGCARALGTYGSYTIPASTGGAASYAITHTFTCATASQTVAAVSLQYGASGANLFVEANLATAATLAVGDSLAITYTINI